MITLYRRVLYSAKGIFLLKRDPLTGAGGRCGTFYSGERYAGLY